MLRGYSKQLPQAIFSVADISPTVKCEVMNSLPTVGQQSLDTQSANGPQ